MVSEKFIDFDFERLNVCGGEILFRNIENYARYAYIQYFIVFEIVSFFFRLLNASDAGWELCRVSDAWVVAADKAQGFYFEQTTLLRICLSLRLESQRILKQVRLRLIRISHFPKQSLHVVISSKIDKVPDQVDNQVMLNNKTTKVRW